MAHHSGDSGSFFALSRHDDYWINGGDLYFLVEHVQFRVHRYFFERESPFFKSRLTTPASPGASRQGSAESNAIVLENVRSADFAKFLWVFYNPKYSLYHTSVEDWTTILDLAYQWQFTEVKNLVVRELEKLEIPDVNRVATYHKYGVDRNLLISRYAALCEREEPLTLKEGLLLGMDTTLMIARTREYARSNPTPTGARSPTAAHIRQEEMHSLVRLLFEIQPPAEGSEDQGDAAAATPPGGLPKPQAQPPTQKPLSPPPTAVPIVVQDKDKNKPEQPTGQQVGKKKGKNQRGKQQPTGQQVSSTPVAMTPTMSSVPPFLPEGTAENEAVPEATAVEAPLLHLETKDLLGDLTEVKGEPTNEQKTADGEQKISETVVEGEQTAVAEENADQGVDSGAGNP